jgi:large repetitive protein
VDEGGHFYESAIVLVAKPAAGLPIGGDLCLSGPEVCPPETSITSGPQQNEIVSTDSVSFGFTSSESPSTFECKLDDGTFAGCTSLRQYTNLSDGPHTFQVRAIDPQGDVDPTPASRTWSVYATQPPPPDTTPPETSIGSCCQPDVSKSTTASFNFTGSDDRTPVSNLKFECRLDGTSESGWSSCTSPQDYPSLSDGSHTFEVRAIDSALNVDLTPASRQFRIDTIAPDTTITSGPSGTVDHPEVSFEFSSSESGSSFECRISGGSWGDCTSPWNVFTTIDGTQTVEVRASDALGNADPTPASLTWTTAIPPTVLSVSPTDAATGVALGANVEAFFSEAIDPDTITDQTFTLAKQGSSSSVVQANVSYDGANKATLDPAVDLEANTSYTATIKGGSTGAKDLVGNVLSADKTWTFSTTDTTAPETTIVSGPSDTVSSTSASFSFSSSEAGSTFQCSLDGASFAGCTSPKSYSSLSQGSHTFRVRATDKAGNVDASPASRSWFVDTVVPKGTISINGGAASTSSRSVTLKLSASDPSPASGVDSMRFRNGGTTTWSSWFDYSTSKSWTLTAGAGTKTVYVQYKDRAGNNSAAASDTIRFSP